MSSNKCHDFPGLRELLEHEGQHAHIALSPPMMLIEKLIQRRTYDIEIIAVQERETKRGRTQVVLILIGKRCQFGFKVIVTNISPSLFPNLLLGVEVCAAVGNSMISR